MHAFQESTSSCTLNIERFENQIILKSLGAIKPKVLNWIAKIGYGYLHSCSIYGICVCLRIVVSNTFFVLRTLCCQFLWIVHIWLPLQYSLTFIFQFLWIVHVWLPLQYSPTFIQQDMCPIVTYMIFYRYVLWPDVWWNNVLASYQSRFYMYTTLS